MTDMDIAAPPASPAEGAQHVTVLGVRVDVVDQAQFLGHIAAWVAERRPRQIVTINPEFIMRARSDPAFKAVLDTADLATPDGVGVIWAARRQGVRIKERIGGADMALPLARQCASLGHRLYLLGAAEGVATEAARRLVRDCSGLCVAGAYAGSPDPRHDDELVARIKAARPDVLLVAYGAPAQDLWIARNKERLDVPVSMGVGGTLDYVAGVHRRAPAIVRRLWLDWAFRLVTQPWRWRRMLAIPRFVWAVWRSG